MRKASKILSRKKRLFQWFRPRLNSVKRHKKNIHTSTPPHLHTLHTHLQSHGYQPKRERERERERIKKKKKEKNLQPSSFLTVLFCLKDKIIIKNGCKTCWWIDCVSQGNGCSFPARFFPS
jgi:hypothetical protein